MEVTGDVDLIKANGELDDAIATIKAAGLDPEHFTMNVRKQRVQGDAGGGLYPVRYAVEITNRASGRGATVAGGHGEAWVERLDQKLIAGEFQ